MGFVDASIHLLNLFAPALGVGIITAGLAKLVWRRELNGVRLAKLALWACGACAIVTTGGLLLTGRDGRMATYGAMVLAAALALLWAGFGPGRR